MFNIFKRVTELEKGVVASNKRQYMLSGLENLKPILAEYGLDISVVGYR